MPSRCPRKPVLGEGPKQYPAHVSIETRQPRRVSRGELYAGRISEQVLDACERLFETPCLGPPRDVRLVLAVLKRYRPTPDGDQFRGTSPFEVVCGARSRHRIRPSSPASRRALMKADA